jgi:hypothetical protein
MYAVLLCVLLLSINALCIMHTIAVHYAWRYTRDIHYTLHVCIMHCTSLLVEHDALGDYYYSISAGWRIVAAGRLAAWGWLVIWWLAGRLAGWDSGYMYVWSM